MKKLLLLNVTANTGSTGRICEQIGVLAQQSGYEVRMAYGRKAINSCLPLWRIGNKMDYFWHGVESRLWDNHGFASRGATRAFVRQIEEWKPDIINIHNLHGYYLNVKILFDYLKKTQIPVVWTFHDCWPFTGHCAHYERIGCYKWKKECNHCPNQKKYPESWIFDRSITNFLHKKRVFNGLNNLIIVTPSEWLANEMPYSFLSKYPVKIINNGVNLELFRPLPHNQIIREKYNLTNKPIILGVANTWKKKKALEDFINLSKVINSQYQIVLVGMKTKQAKGLPSNIIAISRTENTEELASLYSAASVFVNPTYVDNFPTTNIEALACGTPVITYRTGGSAEAVDAGTGVVIEKGDLPNLKEAIELVIANGKEHYNQKCRERARRLYNKEERYMDYISLLDQML